MNRDPGDYVSSTRHPWPCFLFLLPFLIAYEGGVLWLGGTHPETLRNGADTWLHWGLDSFGLHELYWGPVLVAAAFLAWSWWRREDRPYDLVGVYLGMAIESLVFAIGLWGLSRQVSPILEKYTSTFVNLSAGGTAAPHPVNPAIVHVITFLGAGIYEEVLFRLLLFTGLIWVFRHLQIPRLGAILLAAVGSALLFAAAHNIGPYGEKFDGYVFLFRAMAGVYFAFLYKMRGFGIAVGSHAIYDVLVGVVFNSPQ
jgi:membrane protease YdiL (CAAX protease family)